MQHRSRLDTNWKPHNKDIKSKKKKTHMSAIRCPNHLDSVKTDLLRDTLLHECEMGPPRWCDQAGSEQLVHDMI
jgi:hypothetical protein